MIQVRAIEALPDSYRQIEGAMLLKEDTVYLTMREGASLIVQCQALEIEHAPFDRLCDASISPHQRHPIEGR